MTMIPLKLTRIEFQSMIQYLRFNTEGQRQVPFGHQSTNMLVLMDYLESWKILRLLSWSQRRPDKEFKLSIKLPVARALHQEMQHAMLTGHQQLLLDKLDQAIINYRDPHSVSHLIGELFT